MSALDVTHLEQLYNVIPAKVLSGDGTTATQPSIWVDERAFECGDRFRHGTAGLEDWLFIYRRKHGHLGKANFPHRAEVEGVWRAYRGRCSPRRKRTTMLQRFWDSAVSLISVRERQVGSGAPQRPVRAPSLTFMLRPGWRGLESCADGARPAGNRQLYLADQGSCGPNWCDRSRARSSIVCGGVAVLSPREAIPSSADLAVVVSFRQDRRAQFGAVALVNKSRGIMGAGGAAGAGRDFPADEGGAGGCQEPWRPSAPQWRRGAEAGWQGRCAAPRGHWPQRRATRATLRRPRRTSRRWATTASGRLQMR